MKRTWFAVVLVAGMACLGGVSAAEPMELRVYPITNGSFERMSLDEDAEIWMKKGTVSSSNRFRIRKKG